MAEVIHTIIAALFSFDRSPEHFAYNATVEQCTFFNQQNDGLMHVAVE